MANGNYVPQEVIGAEVIATRNKDDYPGLRRQYNYIVQLNTVDPDTGEPVMANEYRTVASNYELSSSSILNRITKLVEENL